MRILIPDTSWLWKPDDPILEQFKNIILFVCLNGKPITDKYECFVSPYEPDESTPVTYGVGDPRLAALASAAGDLSSTLSPREDVVFLTDDDPCTLYPYYVLHELQKKDWYSRFKRLHLITAEPWKFHGSPERQAYFRMLSDMSTLNSLLFLERAHIIDTYGLRELSMCSMMEHLRLWFQEHLITILNGIYENRYSVSYFDFSTMHYVEVKEGFDKLIQMQAGTPEQEATFPTTLSGGLLGMVGRPNYPESNEYINEEIERLLPRTEGKMICEALRQQRIALAEANHIPFESKECPSEGPCAGTCAKCDHEADYLYKQLRKIPRNQRVYPTFYPEHIESDHTQPCLTENNDIIMGEILPPWLMRW